MSPLGDQREDWWADAWQVTDGQVRDVEYRAGLYRVPGKKGDNPDVANRRGLLWRPKPGDIGGFTLNVWLGDVSRALVEDWWDLFIRAVAPGHRLVRYRRTLAGGGSRYCDGEVVAAFEPAPVGNLGIRSSIEVSIPDGTWYDYAGVETQAATPDATLPKRLVLGGRFAGVTIEQHGLTATIDGPANNPLVVDVTDGVDRSWFAYDGVIAVGQSLVVDSATWEITGTGGLVADPAKLRYNEGRYLIVVPPPPGVSPQVELRADGGTGGPTTNLTIAGVPQFAV